MVRIYLISEFSHEILRYCIINIDGKAKSH